MHRSATDRSKADADAHRSSRALETPAEVIRIDRRRVRNDVRRNTSAARPGPVWLLSLIVIVLLLLPVAALAQPGTPGTGAVRGLVRDASGSPLPGAIVGLNTDAGAMIDSAVTDESGAFVFPAVNAGRYTVRVALINFTGAVRNVNVEAGASASIEAT
jgi:hypothetical protein